MTTTYKLTKDPIKGTASPFVHKTENGAVSFIPFDEGNSDYQKYLEWAKTNTAEAAD